MRGCRRSRLSGGLALALSAPLLLAGCVIGPGERDEQAGDLSSELDPLTSEDTPRWDEDGDDVDLPARRTAPWQRAAADRSGDEERPATSTYARSKQTPEPLPWQPQGGSDDHKAASGTDGAR